MHELAVQTRMLHKDDSLIAPDCLSACVPHSSYDVIKFDIDISARLREDYFNTVSQLV